MKRRDFIAASCLAGVAPLATAALAADAGNKDKEYYELRLYKMASNEKRDAFKKYLAEAAIPAWKRLGIGPVGVFEFHEDEKVQKDQSPDLYVLLPAKSPDVLLGANTKMMADKDYLKAAAAMLGTEKNDPAYQRIESSIMLAFDKIPKVEIPTKKKGRIFQLRIYEAHNEERAKKKVEMFNEGGELAVFRDTGMPPVFFGETLAGDNVPNLTYMLGFEDMAAKEAGWKAFLKDPRWDKLKKDPQYKGTVSNITNIMLRPAACSEI